MLTLIVIGGPGVLFWLIQKWVDLNSPWIVFLAFLGYALIGFLMAIFYEYHREKIKKFSSPIALFIVVVTFFAVPVAINYLQPKQEEAYLKWFNGNEDIYAKITYDIDVVSAKGSIGSDWSYNHYLNGVQFDDGDIVRIGPYERFQITSRFVERDSIDDVGEAVSKSYCYGERENYKKDLRIVQRVHVDEVGGRRYAGSSKDFKVTYTFTRVLPPQYTFWKTMFVFENTEAIAAGFLLAFYACLWLYAIIVVFKYISGTNQATAARTQPQFDPPHRTQNYQQNFATPEKENRGTNQKSFTVMVYISSKGDVYHYGWCKHAQGMLSVPLNRVGNRRPCKVCKPPPK